MKDDAAIASAGVDPKDVAAGGRVARRAVPECRVHELLHLRVRNHGKLFRALMSAHVPGWRRWQAS